MSGKDPFSAFKSVTAGTDHTLHSGAESSEEQNGKGLFLHR